MLRYVRMLVRYQPPSRGIAGNICRCTGYAKIVDAIRAAARGTQASLI